LQKNSAYLNARTLTGASTDSRLPSAGDPYQSHEVLGVAPVEVLAHNVLIGLESVYATGRDRNAGKLGHSKSSFETVARKSTTITAKSSVDKGPEPGSKRDSMTQWVDGRSDFKFFQSRQKSSKILKVGERMSGGVHPKRQATFEGRQSEIAAANNNQPLTRA
jgi:hypothetical protein